MLYIVVVVTFGFALTAITTVVLKYIYCDHTLYIPLAGTDYTAVMDDLTFSASVNQVCREVSTIEDDILEDDEQFRLTLTTTESRVIIDSPEATVTIANDESMYYTTNP